MSTTRRILIIAIFLNAIPVFGQRLFVRHYSTAEGLPQNQVFAIHQDQHGFLWFGTGGGLSRYDGRQFRNYTKEHGLASNVIRAIHRDKDQNLWLATDEGISCYKADRDTFISYHSDHIGQGTIRAIAGDDRRLWFATAGGLTRYDYNDHSFTNFTTDNGLPSNLVQAVAVTAYGKVFIGTNQGLAVMHDPNGDRIEPVSIPGSSKLLLRVETLYCDRRNRIFAGTQGGVVRIDSLTPEIITTSDGLTNPVIRGISSDQAGHLWFATEDGLNVMTRSERPYAFSSYTTRNGFFANQYYAVFQDSENNLWFGSSRGVSKLISADLISYTEAEGLGNDVVIGITKAKDKIWYITTNNGISIFSDGRFKNLSDTDGLIAKEIWDAAIDSTEIVWLATYGGLQALLPKEPTTRLPIHTRLSRIGAVGSGYYNLALPANDFIHNNRVVDILVDRRGRIWFASTDKGAGYAQINSSGEIVIRTFTTADGLYSNNIWMIYEDRHGQIWAGTIGGGIARWNESTQRFISLNKGRGLSDDVALSIYEDQRGGLWIGTERGAMRLAPEIVSTDSFPGDLRPYIRLISKRDGLSDNTINAIVEDSEGMIWLGTNNGLNQFNPETGLTLQIYNKKRGLIDNEVSTHNALRFYDHETLIVGTSAGITLLPLRSFRAPVLSRPVVLMQEFMAEDNANKTTRTIPIAMRPDTNVSNAFFSTLRPSIPVVSYLENNITFRFVAPSFKDENDVRYRYRLRGFDRFWSDPTPENHVRYTNLNDGDYVFEVIAGNGNGAWSDVPTRVTFSVMTPIWKSWWFIAFSLTFFSLSIYTAYKFRANIARQRTAELEQKVLQRTRELVVQKETVERILSELKETQIHLIHSEKMASLGQMVAGIAHEINNPVAFVKGNISLLERRLNDLERVFTSFSDVFDFYDKFNDFSDDLHKDFRAKLEEIDRIIASTRFEKFLGDLPQVVNEMRDGVDRTQKIVEDLRNFSRLDESQFKEISIIDSLESTLNILKNEYKTRVTIHRNFGDVPPVYCNPGHINQVFMNLLQNAFQAIEGEGNVWIRAVAASNNILIAIRDDGKGIPAEIQNRVFDPFFTTKPVGKGTGLGLAISYKIIEAHKGTIFFESTPNQGTEFKITLPIRRLADLQKPE